MGHLRAPVKGSAPFSLPGHQRRVDILRRVAPFGLSGGVDAKPGAGRIIRANGAIEPLAATARAEVQVGDAVEIETPGGGGFGPLPK